MKMKFELARGTALLIALSLSACSEGLFKAEETEDKTQATPAEDSEKLTYAQTADLLLTNLVGEKSSQNYESKSAVYASRLTNAEFKKSSGDQQGSGEVASAGGDSAGAGSTEERRVPAGNAEDASTVTDKDDTVSNIDDKCKEITHSNGTVEYYCTGVDVELPPAIDDCVEDVINLPEADGEYSGNSKDSSGEQQAIYHDTDGIGRCHWIEPVMPDPGFCGINHAEPITADDDIGNSSAGSGSEDVEKSESEEDIQAGERDEVVAGDKGKELVYVEPMECTDPIKEKLDEGQAYSEILRDVFIQLLALFDDDMDGKLDKTERKEAVTVILKAMLD